MEAVLAANMAQLAPCPITVLINVRILAIYPIIQRICFNANYIVAFMYLQWNIIKSIITLITI